MVQPPKTGKGWCICWVQEGPFELRQPLRGVVGSGTGEVSEEGKKTGEVAKGKTDRNLKKQEATHKGIISK